MTHEQTSLRHAIFDPVRQFGGLRHCGIAVRYIHPISASLLFASTGCGTGGDRGLTGTHDKKGRCYPTWWPSPGELRMDCGRPAPVTRTTGVARPLFCALTIMLAVAAIVLLSLVVDAATYRSRTSPPPRDGPNLLGAATALTTAEPLPASISCGRAVVGDRSATIDGVEVRLPLIDSEPKLPGGTPSATASYTAVEIVITNRSTGPLSYHPQDFQVTDCLGNVVSAIAGGVEPAIIGGQLPPGATVAGWLTFAMPASNVPLQDVTYRLRGSDRAPATVRCVLVTAQEMPPPSVAMLTGDNACSVRRDAGAAGTVSRTLLAVHH